MYTATYFNILISNILRASRQQNGEDEEAAMFETRDLFCCPDLNLWRQN